MVIQFLAHLPYGIFYLLSKDLGEVGLAHWPAEFNGRPSACIFYERQEQLEGIDRAIDAGCAGVKTDIWVQGDQIFVGHSSSFPNLNNTLNHVYLEPLMARLDATNPAVASSASDSIPAGRFDRNLVQPFILFLRLQSQLSTMWPHLAAQMAMLSQKGYLSYTDGIQVTSRPISIVLTGLTESEIDFMNGVDQEGINGNILLDTSTEMDATSSLKTHRPGNDNSNTERLEGPEDSFHQPSRLPSPIFSISINFRDSIGSPRGGRFSAQQIERIKNQIHDAHRRGFRIRYASIPCLPRMLRRSVWRILVHEGADYIEVDWTHCDGGWWRSLFTIGRDENEGRKYTPNNNRK